MGRRNQGPKLRWFAERNAYYITWTVNGRSLKRSTGTASCEEAQIVFAEWLHKQSRREGPSDPAEALVTDILTDYINERGPKVVGQETMARAVETLARLWEARTVAEVPAHVEPTSNDGAARPGQRGASLASYRPQSPGGTAGFRPQ